MKQIITVLNTGGTFNKKYNKINGTLEIPQKAKKLNKTVKKILKSTEKNIKFEIKALIFKDSLEMTKKDRSSIFDEVSKSKNRLFLIIHGTDTIHLTAEYLARYLPKKSQKKIVLTGAMKPFEIDSIESSLNIGMSLSFLQNSNQKESNIFIAMNGVVKKYKKIKKNRIKGFFTI